MYLLCMHKSFFLSSVFPYFEGVYIILTKNSSSWHYFGWSSIEPSYYVPLKQCEGLMEDQVPSNLWEKVYHQYLERAQSEIESTLLSWKCGLYYEMESKRVEID